MNEKLNQLSKVSDALRQSEEKYRNLLELAPDAFFQGDSEGNFIMANDKALELTGYTREELYKMNISQLFPPGILDATPLRYDLLQKGETIRTNRQIKTRDGRRILVEMNSKAMPDGTYQSFFRDITDRYLAEKALMESEQRFRRLHTSMMDGFVFTDMNGNIIDSNESYCNMLGYSHDELFDLTYQAITPAKWHSIEEKILREQILVKGHSGVYEKEYIRKDGTIFPIEIRTFLIRNDQGENEGMWAIVRDITERKKTEEILRESEFKFRSIIESSPTAMHFYTLGHDGNLYLTGANPVADKILHFGHSSVIGLTIEEAFPNLRGTSIPGMYCDVACGKIGPQSFEIPYEDERFSGYFNVHVFQTGSQSIAVDFTDITSRRHMEEALKRSEIEYRDTLDSLPDWMYVVDDKFNIVMLNASMQQEIIRQGFYQDLVGSLLKVIPPMVEPSDISEIESVFVSGQISITERIFDLAARPAYGVMTLVPILKDGHVMKVVVIIRDKSKEKEIEELKQRNADQKEVLLREIHHRVKNNLAIVISLLNFQLRSNTSSELSKMIIDIQMRIRSMALIHEHLYRSDTLDRIPLDAYIESLAQKILTTFSGHRIRLENDLEHIDVSIETALPIGLIINELLTNAFKYAFPAGTSGVVSIILKHTGQGNCLIIVRDNGIGLPSTIRTDSEKSLGLYIVNLLTEQLEGTLQISTHQGTTFNLNFINRLLCP